MARLWLRIFYLLNFIVLSAASSETTQAGPTSETLCRSRSSSWRSGIIATDDSYGRLRPVIRRNSGFEFLTPGLRIGDLPPTPLQSERFGVLLDTPLRQATGRAATIRMLIGANAESLREIEMSYSLAENCANFFTVENLDFEEFHNTTVLILFEVTSPTGAVTHFGDYFAITEGAGGNPEFITNDDSGGIIRVGNAGDGSSGVTSTGSLAEGSGCSINSEVPLQPSSYLVWITFFISVFLISQIRRKQGEQQ